MISQFEYGVAREASGALSRNGCCEKAAARWLFAAPDPTAELP
jgi:hypothetical protein